MVFSYYANLSRKRQINLKRGIKFLLLWLLWISVGTVWYGIRGTNAKGQQLRFKQGLFMAVNVGYAIGTGDIIEEENSDWLWFSSIYVIIGCSFIAYALSFFAEKIAEDHDNWFTNLVQRTQYDRSLEKGISWTFKVKAGYIQHRPLVRILGVFVLFFIMLTLFGIYIGLTPVGAMYFAISFLSTGGLLGLRGKGYDGDSPENYLTVGIMAMFGVPIMVVAMASVAELFVKKGDLKQTRAMIEEEVQIQELIMMQKFGLEDGDGVIDRSEYIILCMVRMGTDPNLINFISRRFAELDEDGGGTLSIPEITCGKFDCVNGAIVAIDEHGDVVCEIDETSHGDLEELKMTASNLSGGSLYSDSDSWSKNNGPPNTNQDEGINSFYAEIEAHSKKKKYSNKKANNSLVGNQYLAGRRMSVAQWKQQNQKRVQISNTNVSPKKKMSISDYKKYHSQKRGELSIS